MILYQNHFLRFFNSAPRSSTHNCWSLRQRGSFSNLSLKKLLVRKALPRSESFPERYGLSSATTTVVHHQKSQRSHLKNCPNLNRRIKLWHFTIKSFIWILLLYLHHQRAFSAINNCTRPAAKACESWRAARSRVQRSSFCSRSQMTTHEDRQPVRQSQKKSDNSGSLGR